MGVKLSSKSTVTNVGTSKLLLVNDTELNLIDPDDLPGSGGSGNIYIADRYYPLPGVILNNTKGTAYVTSTGELQAQSLKPGDYTGLNVVVQATTFRGLIRVGIYEFNANTETSGNLITDLGEVNINAAGVFTFPNAIGNVTGDVVIAAYYTCTTAGNLVTYTVGAQLGEPSIPMFIQTSTTSRNMTTRLTATLTYPTPNTPTTLPALSAGISATSQFLMLYKAP